MHAAAEGPELLPSSSCETGFKGVTNHGGYKVTNHGGFKGVTNHGGKYQAKINDKGKQRHLGTFATPEEEAAALCYAMHIGAERAAAEAAEVTEAVPSATCRLKPTHS